MKTELFCKEVSSTDLISLSKYAVEHAVDYMDNLDEDGLINNIRTSLITILQCIQQEVKDMGINEVMKGYDISEKTIHVIVRLELAGDSNF